MANEGSASPLDDAIDSVQREDLGGTASKPDEGGDAFAPPAPAVVEPQKKRGRPVNPNSRRARAGKYAGGSAASGPVSDPPLPEQASKEYPKIPVAAVAESLRRIDARIVAATGMQPLTEDEIKGGGEVFAPVLDHYMPLLTQQGGGIWVAPVTWALLAYGPRVWEMIEQRQRDREAKKHGWTQGQGAQSGENGKRTFQPMADETARPFSVDPQ